MSFCKPESKKLDNVETTLTSVLQSWSSETTDAVALQELKRVDEKGGKKKVTFREKYLCFAAEGREDSCRLSSALVLLCMAQLEKNISEGHGAMHLMLKWHT